MDYIATFHTHYGAMRFYQKLKKKEIIAQMMPVPRSLSASCGVCVRFHEDDPGLWLDFEDLDQVVEYENSQKYRVIYQNI